jgi:DNA-directed RNA polymerase subunit RPC12/RpoP
MPRVKCRCGQPLDIPVEGPDRIVCPHCAARIRVRRDPGRGSPGAGGDDGFIRFDCPCGRRLKIRAGSAQEAGKCPDCGRVVAVPDPDDLTMIPARASRPHEAPTEELGPDDIALLERWAKGHLSRQGGGEGGGNPGGPGPSTVRIEAGLRVCPRCGRPVHLGAVTCRECGADVPKR